MDHLASCQVCCALPRSSRQDQIPRRPSTADNFWSRCKVASIVEDVGCSLSYEHRFLGSHEHRSLGSHEHHELNDKFDGQGLAFIMIPITRIMGPLPFASIPMTYFAFDP
ncbi:hypothetical protein PG990_014179 [Apiospora arundinis]